MISPSIAQSRTFASFKWAIKSQNKHSMLSPNHSWTTRSLLQSRSLLTAVYLLMSSALPNLTMRAQSEWCLKIGGSGNDRAWTLIKTNDGNYLVGGFTNSYSASGGQEAYLVKISPSGSILWARVLGTIGADEIRGLYEAANGDILAAGSCNGRGCLMRLNSSGVPIWTKRISSLHTTCKGIAEDASGNIYTSCSRAGYSSSVLAKFTSAGNLIWSRLITTPNNPQVVNMSGGLQIDGSGNIVLGGTCRDNLSVGAHDICVVKVDPSGNLVWFKVYDAANVAATHAMTVVNNDILIAGHWPNPFKAVLLKLSSNGGIVQVRRSIANSTNDYFGISTGITGDDTVAVVGFWNNQPFIEVFKNYNSIGAWVFNVSGALNASLVESGYIVAAGRIQDIIDEDIFVVRIKIGSNTSPCATCISTPIRSFASSINTWNNGQITNGPTFSSVSLATSSQYETDNWCTPTSLLHINFTGKIYKSYAKLKWEVIGDEPLHHFVLNRSIDAIHWTKIAVIKSNQNTEYLFIDTLDPETAQSSTVYYQLQAFYSSGFSLTRIIVLKKSTDILQAFLCGDAICIQSSKLIGLAQVYIYSPLGRLIETKQLTIFPSQVYPIKLNEYNYYPVIVTIKDLASNFSANLIAY